MFKFSGRSEQKLEGVHADLVKVVRRALEITPTDFAVVEGLRTKERQAELFKTGATRTMNSRHLTGHAVDIAPVIDGQIRWDWPAFQPVIDAMKKAADELGVPVIHGADWKTFKDGPHHELDRSVYP